MKNKELKEKVKQEIGYACTPQELAQWSGFARKTCMIMKETKTSALKKASLILYALRIAQGVMYSSDERSALVLFCAHGMLEDLAIEIQSKSFTEGVDHFGDVIFEYLSSHTAESIGEIDICIGNLIEATNEID